MAKNPNARLEVLRYYDMWAESTHITARQMTRMRNEAHSFEYQPKISVLTPVYNPERLWLQRALDSVLSQTYPHWELCICDDGSTKEHVREVLQRYERLDERIKVKYLERNENICRATNHALSLASGEYVGLLDHDDELAANALFEMVKFLQDHRDADLVYSDEDKISENGKRLVPHFKIGFSPDLALAANYLCHFSIYRKTILDELGGWREGFDGAQDLDLVNRFSEKAKKIYHIPKVLYHWRMVEGSTAVSPEGKTYTHERARQSIVDALERRGIKGKVEDGFFPNTFRIEREIAGRPTVSVVIPVRGDPPLERCVEALRRNTSYPNYELLLADAGATGAAAEYLKSSGHRVVESKGSSQAELYNAAVDEAAGEYVLLLDPRAEASSEGWLEAMLQHAQRSEIGAVGARLDTPEGQVMEAGLVLDLEEEVLEEGGTPRFYRPANRRTVGFEVFTQLTRNCSALSSACMMFRKEAFWEAGGFDAARFADEFSDVDFCLRLRERDYLLLYTPYASFTYHGPEHRYENLAPGKAGYVRERWGAVLENDPYYNPNLSWRPGNLREIMGKPRIPHPSEAEEAEGRVGEPEAGVSPPPPAPAAKGPSPAAGRSLLPPRETVSFPPPFFIVGHGRSGTTWLELTLNSHPEILCRGSGMFFGRDLPLFETQYTLPGALAKDDNIRVWHDQRPNYWSGQREFGEDLPGMVRSLADYLMGAELAASGKRIVGDRTPHHVSYLDELYELYPEAKVIHIIRDGRDVAISNVHAVWQNARDRGGPVDLEPEAREKRDAYLEDREGFLKNGGSIFTGEQIEHLSYWWNHRVRSGRERGRELFGDRYAEVRYEELLDDAGPELARLLEFLGADRDPAIVGRMVEENSFERTTGRKPGEEDPVSFHRKGVAGEWREVFTEGDKKVFKEQAGELLVRLGYEKDSGW